MNKYIIYSESKRVNGCVSVEYTAIAKDCIHVIDLAQEQDINLSDYTIELSVRNIRNEMGKPYPPQFKKEF